MAAFIGIYGLSFLALFLCGFLGFLFEANSRQKIMIILIIFLLSILTMGVFGWQRPIADWIMEAAAVCLWAEVAGARESVFYGQVNSPPRQRGNEK